MSDHNKVLDSFVINIINLKNKLKKMFSNKTNKKNLKTIVDVASLNKFLNSHIAIDICSDEEYIKTSKLIRIVNNILSEYDMSILYNRYSFEKAKAHLIKDLIKTPHIKLTKDLIKKYIDSRLTGVRAYSLRKNEK